MRVGHIQEGLHTSTLSDAYSALLGGLRKIAALSIMNNVNRAMLINGVVIEARFRLSSDFDDAATTIIDEEELRQFATDHEFDRIAREQSLIALCSIFESYIRRTVKIAGLDPDTAAGYGTMVRDFGFKRGSANHTLRRIYFLVHTFNFRPSCFELEQSVDMLHEMLTIRNVVVHHDGRIVKPDHERSIGPAYKLNGSVRISENGTDDFLHRIVIHARALTVLLDRHLKSVGSTG
jgi:hypothetical protein